MFYYISISPRINRIACQLCAPLRYLHYTQRCSPLHNLLWFLLSNCQPHLLGNLPDNLLFFLLRNHQLNRLDSLHPSRVGNPYYNHRDNHQVNLLCNHFRYLHVSLHHSLLVLLHCLPHPSLLSHLHLNQLHNRHNIHRATRVLIPLVNLRHNRGELKRLMSFAFYWWLS